LFRIDDYDHFCSIWTTTDIDDLEYSGDLKFYWQRGYGYDLNWKIAVELFKGNYSKIIDIYSFQMNIAKKYIVLLWSKVKDRNYLSDILLPPSFINERYYE
tara:strand:+ start:553 stop:855 length:303 start_codon:yes stop_codon:yes gene_type:complete